MPSGQRLAVERIAIRKFADALVVQKFLDAIAQYGFVRIFLPPGIIHGPVTRASPRVITEWCRFTVTFAHLGGIEITSLGSQPGRGAGYFPEKVTADIRRFRPEGAVL